VVVYLFVYIIGMAKFLFSKFTKHLKFEEKRERVENEQSYYQDCKEHAKFVSSV